ncbi:MAG: His/Gly/Thr/Pro-type tRNA ligase C-terminal domain-containing protein, partial [Ilumatobacteraceae bacterium]
SWDQRSMKAQMKAANRSGARFAVIIGESEREAGTALIRDLRSDEEQLSVARADLTGTLMSRLSSLQGASS